VARRIKIIFTIVLIAYCLADGKLMVPDLQSQIPATPNAIDATNEPQTHVLPTLFIIGDSTASNGADLGWGSHLGKYFDPARIAVLNRARGGRSSRTFHTEGLWDATLAQLKPGDFVLIQFGHNDGGAIDDAGRARGSLPGLGDETREIDNPVTGKHEIVQTYGWYMRKFIADTRSKGAVPILLSLTVRNIWRDGRVERGSGNFSAWTAQIAQAESVSFLDLTNLIADQYELLGQKRVAGLFPRDHTHTNAEGANLNAAAVVSLLRALSTGPLADMLSREARTLPSAPKNYVASNAGGVGAGEVTKTEFSDPNIQSAISFILPTTQLVLSSPWMPDVQPKMDPNLPTLFCIGDSTVRTGSRGDGAGGQWGWGAPISEFFDRARLNVENRAMGGTSSRTFQALGLWDKVLADIKPGDFVVLQFGHNDASPPNDTSRARGTIRGSGDQTEEIDNQLTGKHETVHTYGWYIRKFIADARAKGAAAIVCSPMPRNNWAEGKVIRATEDYARWASEAAKAEGSDFIDLNELIARQYEQMGRDNVTSLCFPAAEERTHTSAYGARLNATCVVDGIKALKDHPLLQYLKAPGGP
jgi:lysophospholipase L1-like esterase